MSLIDKVIQAFEDTEKHEKFIASQKQRQEMLVRYFERYWNLALVVWEIANANTALLKINLQKDPKWLKPKEHKVKFLDTFDYVLHKNFVNIQDSAIPKKDIAEKIKQFLILCDFSNFDIECEEDSYFYYLKIRGYNSGVKMGRPMSNKIGILSVKQYVDVNNIPYYAFDITYFDGSNYGGIKDNTAISIYNEGLFIPTFTRRDPSGNVGLSRLPFQVCPEYGYLAII